MHVTSQKVFDEYKARGYGFFTVSNYYPSAPYYPLKKMTRNYYIMHHEHPVMVDGKLTPGPFDWNAIVAPWIDEVEDKFKKNFPFKEGGLMFTGIPEDFLEAPNAEHHSFKDSCAHINAPGSFYASGTFDAHNFYHTVSNGKYCFGTGLPWRTAFDNMLKNLQYPDGGGITINHPSWSSFPRPQILEMLDYDPRVLGLEVYNHDSTPKAWSEDYWDFALATGRQCFGFFVTDWNPAKGLNVLIVPEHTAHACLQAYRQGNWYGALLGNVIHFTNIAFDGTILTAKCDDNVKFQVISKQGITFETTGRELSFKVPTNSADKLGYLRIKAFATDNSGEILFSQPFMLN